MSEDPTAEKPATRSRLSALRPPPEASWALVVQTFTYSVGSGFYAAGSVIFFIVYTGLSATQIALGMSIAGIVALAMRLPCGMLADRLGGRSAWLLGAVGQAVLFAAYPWVAGFAAFVVVISLIGLAASLGNAGRGRYIGEVVPGPQRVKVMAYLRSVLNMGMGLGTAAAGFLVSIESRPVLAVIVLANAATFVLDVVLLYFFMPPGQPKEAGDRHRPASRRALSDRPFVVLSLVNAVFMLTDTVLTVVLPLWILRHTDAPRSIIPILLLINMIMITVLQVWASSGGEGIAGDVRRQVRATIFVVLACALVPLSAMTSGALTSAVLISTVTILTVGELFAAASSWGLGYGLTPDDRRAEYLAVFNWGGQFAEIVGPAGMTALALAFVPGGWLVIAGTFAVAGVATKPVVGWVTRSRQETEPPKVRESVEPAG